MPDLKTDIDSPATYGPSGGPGEALKMPTKSYPESNVAKHPGKKTTIEGPCTDKEGY